MEVIARIRNDFPMKFGLPRQAGLAPSLRSKIVFEPAYRVPEALRGLEGFSHIWLIWGFSAREPAASAASGGRWASQCDSSPERWGLGQSPSKPWSPTVRPPRLGGNVRIGVFATRSPFRPNPIGLSSVRLESIEEDGANGRVLIVSGADLMDGTPIYDIKPYLPGVDAHPEAAPTRSSFSRWNWHRNWRTGSPRRNCRPCAKFLPRIRGRHTTQPMPLPAASTAFPTPVSTSISPSRTVVSKRSDFCL